MEQHLHDEPARYHLLSKEEIADPYRVLDTVFDLAHLPDLRLLVWEWLKTTMAGGFQEETSPIEKRNILSVYEQVQRLIEAADILHQRTIHLRKDTAQREDHPF
jgi:hypothetical protein